MNKTKLLTTILIFALQSSYAQNSFLLQDNEYRIKNNKWYKFNQNFQNEIITNRIIVRTYDKNPLNINKLKKIGIPDKINIIKMLMEKYYILILNQKSDHFDIAKKLEQSKMFDVILFDFWVDNSSEPNDEYFPNQWNLDDTKVQMEKAWDFTTGDSTIIVAVIDQGMYWQHEDLVDNIWQNLGEDADGDGHTIEKINGQWQYDPGDINNEDDDLNGKKDDFIGWNFFSDTNIFLPIYHGTAVSGIIGAKTHNDSGVSGVSGGWNNKKGNNLLVIKAGSNKGIVWSAVIDGIMYAANNNVDIINTSLEYCNDDPELEQAVQIAHLNGCILISAAGNQGIKPFPNNTLQYPAAYSNTISVGATIPDDTRYDRSCIGDYPQKILDIMAPGGHSIWSTMQNGGYTSQMGGTSASAPHVSGLAGLILSLNPDLTFAQVRNILRNTADKVSGMNGQNYTDYYGYGPVAWSNLFSCGMWR